MNEDLLRRDVRLLGGMLGEMIRELAGQPTLDLVEDIRRLARDRRAGAEHADWALADKIACLDESQARSVTRAFSIYFDLANLAEDRHRVRVLHERQVTKGDQPIGESIGEGIAALAAAGFTAEQTQQALDAIEIELVFTAHPSEAKRRSTRGKLRRMRQWLQQLDSQELLPHEHTRIERKIRAELTVLWQSEFLRPWRPTVLQEVERGVSILPRLYDVVPDIYEALRRALAEAYPDHDFRIPVFLRFGSWMGGDRDGNPNVTAEVTESTLLRLRSAALAMQLEQCEQMSDFLSISQREVPPDDAIADYVRETTERWPDLRTTLETVSPLEVYRQFLAVVHWRLERSRVTSLTEAAHPAAYRGGVELASDLQRIADSLRHHDQRLLEEELLRWIDLVRVFGLHSTRLDLRQEAGYYRDVMNELFAKLDLVDNFGELTEDERVDLLSRTIPWREPLPEDELSDKARETLATFRLIAQAIARFGGDVLGGHVISLTREASDVLTVLWLWRWAQADAGVTTPPEDELRIIPLFEKVHDLREAPHTLERILTHSLYKDHLARQGGRQIVMVGYSDSTKDGGYLAACWGLYRAQSGLHETAERHGVRLTFFHGRGGSLGRGGGPAARGIRSLPPHALDGTLRLTEQGEVLAERYDDPQIAYRHLEQVTWATLLSSALPAASPPQAWLTMLDELSERSWKAYRELVDTPGFIEFFSQATPIEEIENLPIGSRPSRRRGKRTLDDLRAIPWVFSWTQNRCMIPAWYGLGAAIFEVCGPTDGDPTKWNMLRTMYREWTFLQATVANAALALAKADMFIARRYAELADAADVRQRFWSFVAQERDRSREAILALTEQPELLSDTPWLQSSIEVRNPYVDPLNLIQIELLRRRRAALRDATEEETPESEQLRDLLRLTVQGIAAGMRTTG